MREWLSRLFFMTDASVVTLTNWPSSSSRGVDKHKLPLTGKFIMDSNKQNSEKKTKSTTVSDETILKISKEIAVKFIEVGRITPATFHSAFTTIYGTIDQTVRKK